MQSSFFPAAAALRIRLVVVSEKKRDASHHYWCTADALLLISMQMEIPSDEAALFNTVSNSSSYRSFALKAPRVQSTFPDALNSQILKSVKGFLTNEKKLVAKYFLAQRQLVFLVVTY